MMPCPSGSSHWHSVPRRWLNKVQMLRDQANTVSASTELKVANLGDISVVGLACEFGRG